MNVISHAVIESTMNTDTFGQNTEYQKDVDVEIPIFFKKNFSILLLNSITVIDLPLSQFEYLIDIR